ncbi:HigA family addiction module antitoxin [Phocaeicola plebeius]|jgi:addiction module HigA family antidote|uniref:HigA family addiction module antitoxin n=1 Tax=Phocaeicola plebeius TaxID=310297 RepID=UPI00241FDBF8|nr:HigA family addiction module antitoxin [Phocaeicola plebeius]
MIEIQGIDPTMIANNLTPAYPTHPGEVLKEEIEYRKISQRKLSEQMGISYKILNDILNCRRPVTTQTAMLFEAALDIPADSLMRLQLKYNMQQAAANPSFMERLKQVRKCAAML